jgi:hypothetical protein
MSVTTVRKTREKEFYVNHIETFKKVGESDPAFLIKTAFFQKGKYGRQVQFFESELNKGQDLYVEFYDNVTDNSGTVVDVKPFYENRQLFRYRYNPFYSEEYDKKSGVSSAGSDYSLFTVPLQELLAVNPDGSTLSYGLFEKRLAEIEEKKKSSDFDIDLPRLQNSLVNNNDFPDFTEELKPKTNNSVSEIKSIPSIPDVLYSEMTIADYAAIIWKKPVSNRQWLNELITKQ